jgi:hypothetical protein
VNFDMFSAQKSLLIVALLAFTIGGIAGALLRRPLGAAVRTLPDRLGLRSTAVPLATPAPTPGVASHAQGKLQLFLLAGQSNMSGYGSVPEQQAIDPRIFVFGNDYRWRLAREPLDAETDQVDLVSLDANARLGPGMAFARTLVAQEPEMLIGLIPCARGDTTITEWQRSLDDNSLYGSCLKRARAASPMGELAGILFFQGESDAVDALRFPDRDKVSVGYAEAFMRLVEAFRTDLGQPQLPLVFAQIGSHTSPEAYTAWTTVQAEQARVELPCSAMIITSDLALQDHVHFTTESYITIGERFAVAMQAVLQQPGCQ